MAVVGQLAGVSAHVPKGGSRMPGQGIYLHCGFNSLSGHVRKAADQFLSHIIFFFLSLSPFISLK